MSLNFYQTTWCHIPQASTLWSHCSENFMSSKYNLNYRFMAYECLRMGPEDLRILVSSEMVRVFSVGASGTCTIVVETHLRYMITGISSTKLLQNLFSLHFNKLCEESITKRSLVSSLFWTFMLQQKVKLMMWRTASMRNWNMCLINSLNTIWKLC
jgi:hypothetical protein